MIIAILTMMMIPIEVVLLLKDIEHGDEVHRLQQPLPSALVQVTCSAVGASVGDDVGIGVGVSIHNDHVFPP